MYILLIEFGFKSNPKLYKNFHKIYLEVIKFYFAFFVLLKIIN